MDRAAYVAPSHRWSPKLVVSIEGRLFPIKSDNEFTRQHRPNIVITSASGIMIDPFLMGAVKRHGIKTAVLTES